MRKIIKYTGLRLASKTFLLSFVFVQILNVLKYMLYTPLEQFQIILLFSIKLFCFDFSITNLVLVNFLVLLIFMLIVSSFSSNENYLKEINFVFIPST